MTLQTQHTANAPATLTDEQRRRVAGAIGVSGVTRGRQLEAEKMSVTLPDEATGAAKIIGVDQRSR